MSRNRKTNKTRRKNEKVPEKKCLNNDDDDNGDNDDDDNSDKNNDNSNDNSGKNNNVGVEKNFVEGENLIARVPRGVRRKKIFGSKLKK